MIKIRIDNEERTGIDPSWINQQINRRRQEGISVCVIVTIEAGAIGIVLLSSSCYGRRGRTEPLSAEEQAIAQFWVKDGMKRIDFRGEHLINFLRRVEHLA